MTYLEKLFKDNPDFSALDEGGLCPWDYTNSMNPEEANFARLCCKINEVIAKVDEEMRFKVGDRVIYRCEGSIHNGRVGTIVNPPTERGIPYWVLFDATIMQPEYLHWTWEECLAPYVEKPQEHSGKSKIKFEIDDRVQEPETFRDRLYREYPECVDDEYIAGCSGCPCDYEYEPKPKICDGVHEHICSACWDRLIPKDNKNC